MMKSMIVCPEAPASAVGEAILQQGGNAADAAIAAAFAQGVTNPLYCGLGGTAILLVMDRDGRTTVLNGETSTGSRPVPTQWIETVQGRSETIGRFIVSGDGNQMGPQSVMVPGFVAACTELFERFSSGRFTWSELIEPSIRLAADGFKIYPYIAEFWSANSGFSGSASPGYPSILDKFAQDQHAREIYSRDGSNRLQVGETFRQPLYAQTLDQLASAGGDDFYRGEIGRVMASDLERRGSLLQACDITTYRAQEDQAIHATYRGHEIVTSPPPSPGIQLIEMLDILEQCDVMECARGSVEAVDTIAQVMRAAFADNRNLKSVLPIEADHWVQQIRDPKRIAAWGDRIRSGDRVSGEVEQLSTGTTHVVAVDEQGLAVSFTHSIGSIAGSGTMTPELGFLYNNFLGHFDPRPGTPMSILPGRRIGTGVPTIVRRDGATKLVIGAPGGSRIITSIFQVILDVLVRKTPVDLAVKLPRFHSEERLIVHLEREWPDALQRALEARGCTVARSRCQGRVQAIEITSEGRLIAGGDPRGGTIPAATIV